MRIVKKIVVFSSLILLNVLLLLTIILNNISYDFGAVTYVDISNAEEECESVYYEPYNIFKYRFINGYGSWLTKEGNVVKQVIIPGEKLYLVGDSEETYQVLYDNGNSYNYIDGKTYEQLKKRGVSEDENNPVENDYFIAYDEDQSGYIILEKDEMLGKMKACKE